MKFSRLAQYLEKLEGTSSMLEMTAILAELLAEADVPEVRQISYLALGRLGPLYDVIEFNIAEKLMLQILSRTFELDKAKVLALFKAQGDLGTVAEELSSKRPSPRKSNLGVDEVYQRLLVIAKESGGGSQERKIVGFTNLLKVLDPVSCRYAVRIPLGKLRLGFAEKTLFDALSWLASGNKSLKGEIEKAYFIYPDIGEIAARFKEGGLPGLSQIKMKIGVPVMPARCQREKSVEAIMARMGGRALAEYKFDGTRVQLHFDRDQQNSGDPQEALALGDVRRPSFLVKTFTRNLEETTPMFPEIVAAAGKQINARACILDGEAIGVDPKTGRFVPFQITVQRKRKYQVREKAAEVPLKFFAFDILYLDGKNLLTKPFAERRRMLETVIKEGETFKLTPQQAVSQPKELTRLLAEAVGKGLEGLVIKNSTSPYEAGARGYSWIKLKQQKDTVDTVVLGYYTGEGQRAQFGIGGFLVGVYDVEQDVFQTISKVGSGLTDEQFPEMKRRCDKLRVKVEPSRVEVPEGLTPDVWVKPSMVVAIRADEISKSPRHSSGYALRFPRLIDWRDDKAAEDATTVSEVVDLFDAQHNS